MPFHISNVVIRCKKGNRFILHRNNTPKFHIKFINWSVTKSDGFQLQSMGMTYINDDVYKATCITVAILILVLMMPTFTINLATIIVFVKKTVLHTPAFFIIANMAAADFLTSCTTYLMLPIVLAYMLLGRDPCSFVTVGNPLGYAFCLISFLSIVLQSVERYLAIFYPFWYHDR